MITKISNSYTTSFGLARLTQQGKNAAKIFGYKENSFVNDDMFHKQGIFEKSALSVELSKGKSFENICKEYATSNLGAINASFIKNQILSKKAKRVLKSVPKSSLEAGFKILYDNNYDNPQLSVKDTKKLIEKYKPFISNGDYMKNIGLLEAGTVKK